MEQHWSTHAYYWPYIKPPLRPSETDLACLQQIIERLVKEFDVREEINVLLLGVTSELAQLQWALPIHLLTVDKNITMIKAVWPKKSLMTVSHLINADWLRLPLAKNSVRLVLGDGVYSVLSSARQYAPLNDELYRVLNPNGYFVVRHFIRPTETESIQVIFSDLMNKKISNIHVFKWRLAMALQNNVEEGVCLHSIWDSWNQAGITMSTLSSLLNWPWQEIDTLNSYFQKKDCYTFPTKAELDYYMVPYFIEQECHYPAYELGERCPLVLYQPKH